MGIKVNQAGSLVPAKVLWVNGSLGWKPWKYGFIKQASGWVQFWSAQVVATVSPTSLVVTVYAHIGGGTTTWEGGTSSSCTATATLGIGPYTYAWTVTNPGVFFVSTGATTATATFGVPAGVDPVQNTATATCLVTDTTTGLTASANCALTATIVYV